MLAAGGPAEIIRRVRLAESDGTDPAGGVPDDATVAYWTRISAITAPPCKSP